MFKTIENDVICAFDVDQTLVLWDSNNDPPSPFIEIRNPYDGQYVNCNIHEAHVRLIKQMKARGRYIIVWSAGGAEWAETVVRALGLEHSVDICMTKPMAYVDDVPVAEWLQHRIFIPMKDRA